MNSYDILLNKISDLITSLSSKKAELEQVLIKSQEDITLNEMEIQKLNQNHESLTKLIKALESTKHFKSEILKLAFEPFKKAYLLSTILIVIGLFVLPINSLILVISTLLALSFGLMNLAAYLFLKSDFKHELNKRTLSDLQIELNLTENFLKDKARSLENLNTTKNQLEEELSVITHELLELQNNQKEVVAHKNKIIKEFISKPEISSELDLTFNQDETMRLTRNLYLEK